MTQAKKNRNEIISQYPFVVRDTEFLLDLKSHSDIQKYFSVLPQIVWTVDLNGYVTYLNEKWWKYTGLNPKKYDSHDAIQCIYPDDLPLVVDSWSKTFTQGDPFDLQFRLKAKSGEYEWHHGVLNPVRGPQGEIREWFGIITNIDSSKKFAQECITLLDRVPSLAWKSNLQGQVYFANKAFFQFVGVKTVEELNQLGWNSIIHPDDYFELVRLWIQANENGLPYESRYRLRNHDGKYRWLTRYSIPLRDTCGKLTGWLGVSTDVHDLIEAKRDVDHEKRRLNMALSVSGMGAWEWNVDQNSVNADHKTCSLFGIEHSKGLYRSEEFFAVIDPEDLDRVFSLIHGAIRWSKEYSIEFKVVLPSDQRRWLRCMGSIIVDSTSRQKKVLGVVLDVSVQKTHPKVTHLDPKRFDPEKSFRAFFEHSSLPMQVSSANGTLLEVNSAWEKLFGATREQLRNYNVFQDPHAEQMGIRPYLHQTLAGQTVKVPPFYFDPAERGKVGRPHWLEGVFFPIKDEWDQVREFGVVLLDISDREFSTQRLKRSNEHLEKAVLSRQELINICGHELKTPLSSLKLQTQTIQRKIAKGDSSVYEPERVRFLLNRYDQYLDRLVQIVDDMLDLTRVSSGKLVLKQEKVNLSQLVSDTLDRFADQLVSAGCQLKTSLTPNVIGYWDRFRIEQVLTNLLTNAMKYGKGTPIRVSVTQSDSFAYLSVRDQGIGIAAENQKRIFDRFERASTSEHLTGLGLGLYIVKEIVHAHDGAIWVESELGKGSNFIVKLPVMPTIRVSSDDPVKV